MSKIAWIYILSCCRVGVRCAKIALAQRNEYRGAECETKPHNERSNGTTFLWYFFVCVFVCESLLCEVPTAKFPNMSCIQLYYQCSGILCCILLSIRCSLLTMRAVQKKTWHTNDLHLNAVHFVAQDIRIQQQQQQRLKYKIIYKNTKRIKYSYLFCLAKSPALIVAISKWMHHAHIWMLCIQSRDYLCLHLFSLFWVSARARAFADDDDCSLANWMYAKSENKAQQPKKKKRQIRGTDNNNYW